MPVEGELIQFFLSSWGGSPPHDPGSSRTMDGADLMPPPAAPRPPSVRPMVRNNTQNFIF